MKEISIIVPVYNVEKYLPQCLDSILNQTFKDFECICVNDGSTDNSLKILQEYEKKDNRIKIISQENKGLSGARNTGLKAVNSKYLTFIDSDDWITENYLEILHNKIEETKTDIVRASYKFYYQDRNTYESARIRKIHKLDNDTDIEKLYKGYAGAFVWAKIYKTSLIKDNNLLFYEGRMSEDCPFLALAFLYSKNIEFINDEILFYRKTTTSLTGNKEKEKIDAFYNFITLTNDLQKRNFTDKETRKFCIDIFLYKIGSLGKKVSKQNLEQIYPATMQNMFLLKNFSKDLNFMYKTKIKLSMFLLKVFNIYSFKILRIFKNFFKN